MRNPHEQDHDAEQGAQLLRTETDCGASPELGADNSADEQQAGEHHVHRLVAAGLEHGGDGGGDDDLEQAGAHHHAGRHAQQVDHGRHEDEAAAHAHDGGEDAR
jgi:hypothetical protein